MKQKIGFSLGILAVVHASSSFAADVKRECVAASTDGQTSRDAGKLLQAREQFLVCSRDACPSVVRSSCGKWLAELDQQLPSVVIRAADAANSDITDGTAKIDDKEFPLDGKPVPLDPGKHSVVVETSNGVHLEKKFLLGAGEKSRLIELRVEGPAPEPAAKSGDAPERSSVPDRAPAKSSGGVPTGAWVLGGVGVVGLGSFAFFGLQAKSELNKLKSGCSPDCAPSQADTGKHDALIADISLGVGAVALVSAITWSLLSSSSSNEQPPKSALVIAPSAHGGYALVTTHF